MLIWTRKKGTSHTLAVKDVPADDVENDDVENDDGVADVEAMEIPEADMSAAVVKKPRKKA